MSIMLPSTKLNGTVLIRNYMRDTLPAVSRGNAPSSTTVVRDGQSFYSDRTRSKVKNSIEATDTMKNYAYSFELYEEWKEVSNAPKEAPEHVLLINFLADQSDGHYTKRSKTKAPAAARGKKPKGKLLYQKGKQLSYATLDARRWAVLKMLKLKGIFINEAGLNEIAIFMKSLSMEAEQSNPKQRRGQAAPLRPADVDKILSCPLVEQRPRFYKLRERAIIAVARTTGAREQEMFGKLGLRIKDLVLREGRIELTRMVLKNGKRIRDGLNYIIPKGDQNCPVKAITEYLNDLQKLPGITPDNALFIALTSTGRPKKPDQNGVYQAVGPKKFDQKIRDWALAANLENVDIEQLSGHSFRMGLIIYLLESGMDPVKISEITKQDIKTIMRYGQSRTPTGFSGEL